MRAATRSSLSLAALLLFTAAVYVTPAVFPGDRALQGLDYFQLHFRRIAFAREALFGPQHYLPGWYPKELLGTPFAANVQSFPWIPTRLLLLLIQNARLHYALAVMLAACLSALFTYLYARRIGLSELASSAAGWTFACAGFFASRVYAGHLPLLEAYPALPLLLWLVERSAGSFRDLLLIALAAAGTALAGHPQLPAYALGTTLLYALYRKRGKQRVYTLAALLLGAGATLVVWWPMLLLIGRSTRVLALKPPSNDVSVPLRRLLALIWPGIDGWPTILDANSEFSGPYPNEAWFWDTAAYVGLLPLLALVWLAFQKLRNKRWPAAPFAFFVWTGIAALFFALPAADFLRNLSPIVLFRSPARLLYICTFAISLALGTALDQLQNSRRKMVVAIAALLLLHVLDLGAFDRKFVQTVSWKEKTSPPAFAAQIVSNPAGSRVAIEGLPPWCALCEDAGGFDSIFLSSTYEGMLQLAGDDPKLNIESFDASELPAAALEKLAVQYVVTSDQRNDLDLIAAGEELHLYRTRQPLARAAAEEGTAYYVRTSSDRIELLSGTAHASVVKVLESFDPGWTAEVDGVSAVVQRTDGFLMGIPVPAGRHLVRLQYETPGRGTGWSLTAMDLILLAGLLFSAGREAAGRRAEPNANAPS